MKKYARILAFLLAGVALLEMLAILWGGLHDDIQPSDLGVVLGAKAFPDGRPSAGLQARLDEAIILYRRGMFPAILVSGGTGEEGVSEAQVMAHYLMAQGKIPQKAIVLDGHGDTTEATALNTARIMHRHQMKSVMIVTQYYHIVRSRLAFEKAGIAIVHHAYTPYFFMRDFYSVPREMVALPAYWLRHFPKAGLSPQAAEPAGARAFMERALAHGWDGYGSVGSIRQEARAMEPYFTQRLALALAIDNIADNGQPLGYVDADQLCQCQDSTDLKEHIVSVSGQRF